MTEILIGLGIVIVGLVAARLLAGRAEPPDESGSLPRWVEGRVVSVEETGTYLGHTQAEVVVAAEDEGYELSGLIPGDWSTALGPGAAVRAHLQHGVADTLAVDRWQSGPQAVLESLRETLAGAAELRDVEWCIELDVNAAGRDGVVRFAEDGWLTIEFTTDLDPALEVEMWAHEELLEDEALPLHHLHGRLVTNRESFEGWSAELARIETDTLEALEDFVVGTGGTAELAEGAISFDCAIVCARPDLVEAIVAEALRITRTLLGEASGSAQHW